jgi:hypothetical protein
LDPAGERGSGRIWSGPAPRSSESDRTAVPPPTAALVADGDGGCDGRSDAGERRWPGRRQRWGRAWRRGQRDLRTQLPGGAAGRSWHCRQRRRPYPPLNRWASFFAGRSGHCQWQVRSGGGSGGGSESICDLRRTARRRPEASTPALRGPPAGRPAPGPSTGARGPPGPAARPGGCPGAGLRRRRAGRA